MGGEPARGSAFMPLSQLLSTTEHARPDAHTPSLLAGRELDKLKKPPGEPGGLNLQTLAIKLRDGHP